jgi:signal transduction histidine kinase
LRPHLLTTGVRLTLLALVAVLGLLADGGTTMLAGWLLLVVAALPGLVAPTHPVLSRLGQVAEVVIAGLVAVRASGALGASLPYLAAPVFAAGVFAGATESLALVALAAVTLSAAAINAGIADNQAFALDALQWVVVSGLAGVIAARIRWLLTARIPQSEPEYVQATRLLTQLRMIARQLPGTLDPRGIAERLLDELRDAVPAERGAVFTGSGGGRLEVLAQSGPERVDWETSVAADTPIAEAWASQQPQIAGRSLARTGRVGEVSTLVLPLVTGVRTVGLVVLEADRAGAYPQTTVSAASELTGHAALRLETALLFDDVRSLATSEERQRLAREIHDGVAQELVMVGYGIDNAIAELPPGSDAAYASLHALRGEVTRVITELRLSLFELRSDVDRHGGLATAIADYARTVGASAGLRVHLSLDESTARLPAAVESELLRIAQEAITNARKHANATNLWVGCEIDPPYARLEVTDDGRGIGEAASESSYGMSIMAERAARVRAQLVIEPREAGGTTVRVVLGSRSGRGSVSLQQEEPPDRVN